MRELGLGERLIPTGSAPSRLAGGPGRPGAPARVHVVRGDRLVPLPAGLSLVVPTRPGPLVRSPLLSFRGKLRLGLDLVLPGRETRPGGAAGSPATPCGDESVAELIRRRFGSEYLERLAGPLLAGIHSTDPEELSVAAAFPHLREMERRHRSLLLAARKNGAAGGRRRRRGEAARRPRTRRRRGSAWPAAWASWWRPWWPPCGGPGSSSFQGPRGDRPRAAPRRRLAAPPRRRRSARCRRGGPGGAGGGPAHLLSGLEPGLAAAPGAISHVSSATVSLGYPRAAVSRPLDGLGFLVPRDEPCRVSACTFSSEKFPERAPEGHVLLRAFVGGGWAPGGARPGAARRRPTPTARTATWSPWPTKSWRVCSG